MKRNLNYFYKFFKSKLSSKIWQSYVLTSEQYKEFKISNKINLNNLIKIPVPKNYLISADPSFFDKNNILFESIKMSNGCGQIFIYNFFTRNLRKLPLKQNIHYSFPNYYEIKNKKYLTFESNEDYGLIMYRLKSDIYNANEIKLERIEIINNPQIQVLDPVIIKYRSNYFCFAADINQPNTSKCIGKISFKEDDTISINQEILTNKRIPHRLGGKSIVKDKGIILYGQISNFRYGEGIQKFILEENKSLKPLGKLKIKERNFFGPHTLNYSPCRKFVCIDICHQSFNFLHLIVKVMQFLNNKAK